MSDQSDPAAARPNPLTYFFGPDPWRQGWANYVANVEAVADEYGRVEARGAAQARTLIDESARLAHATLDYATQLSAGWRRLMFGALRPR